MIDDVVMRLRDDALDAASLYHHWATGEWLSAEFHSVELQAEFDAPVLAAIFEAFDARPLHNDAARLVASIGFAVLREGADRHRLMRELSTANRLFAAGLVDVSVAPEYLAYLGRWLVATFERFEAAEAHECNAQAELRTGGHA